MSSLPHGMYGSALGSARSYPFSYQGSSHHYYQGSGQQFARTSYGSGYHHARHSHGSGLSGTPRGSDKNLESSVPPSSTPPARTAEIVPGSTTQGSEKAEGSQFAGGGAHA